MRSQSVWATQTSAPSEPRDVGSIALVLVIALVGTILLSGAMSVYQVWFN